jgi:hypothetical protein
MEYNPDVSLEELARDYWDDNTLEEMYLHSMLLVNTPELWPAIILNVANETIGVCRAEFTTRGMNVPAPD